MPRRRSQPRERCRRSRGVLRRSGRETERAHPFWPRPRRKQEQLRRQPGSCRDTQKAAGSAEVALYPPVADRPPFVLCGASVYTFLRKRSPTAVLPARAGSDSQSQSNLFRPDLFCLSVNIPDLESIQLTLARTCAVIVNVPDLKAYSSVAALLLRRVTSYASSEALLYVILYSTLLR